MAGDDEAFAELLGRAGRIAEQTAQHRGDVQVVDRVGLRERRAQRLGARIDAGGEPIGP